MVALASRLNPTLGIMYGVLLLMGMFSNGLASLVALMEYVNRHVKAFDSHRKITMAVLMLLVWVASLAGFGNLVGTVIPASWPLCACASTTQSGEKRTKMV